MNKVDTFKKEYQYIQSQKYKENIQKIINILPDYFFEVPASSTGKYHPAFSLGEGGLVRHTKAACRIAYELFNNQSISSQFKQEEKDLMICGLLVHDGLKHGLVKSEYVVADHPLQISNYIKENKQLLTLTENEIKFLCNVIESHMGEWNKDYKGNEILPVPINKYQKFVHMCDYLSSKKFLDIRFEDGEIVF